MVVLQIKMMEKKYHLQVVKMQSSGSLIRILKSIQMEIEIRQQMKEYN